MSEQVYNLLVELDERSKRCAAAVPATEDMQETWSGIGFRMGSYYFVSPMDEVSEVIEFPPLTVLPGVKSWVKGIANVRGRLLPVMDLSFFFNLEQKEKDSERHVIVINKDDLYSGLLVDEVLGMQYFSTDLFQENAQSNGESFDAFVKGSYTGKDGIWNAFQLFELAKDPDFLKAAI